MVRAPAGDQCSILRRRTWTPEEDQKLVAYIQRYRIWNWNHMAKFAGLSRSGKSCRLRWMNYLRPNIRHGNFSEEEEELIVKLQRELGNRWSVIASKLPGRTDNEIKNCWNIRLRNKMKHKLSPPELEIKTVKSSELEGITLMSSPQLSNISYSWSSVDSEETEKSSGAENKMDTLEWFIELGSLWEEPLKIAAQGLCTNLEATQTQEHLNSVLLDRIWE